MAITYTWSVDSMDVTKSIGGKADVVTSVHWRYIATENEHVSSVYGQVMLGEAGDDFIAFQDVTRDQVLTWTKAAIFTGEDEAPTEEGLTAALENQINNLKNPPVVSKVPDAWLAAE